MGRSRMYGTAALVLALVAACATAGEGLLEEARGVAGSVPPRLLAVLQEEMAAGGPEGAIGVCRDKAPQLAQEASERSGWQVRRVSLGNRNPRAVPDAWERTVLEDFDRRVAAGESPAGMERGEVVAEAGVDYYRYMMALPVQPLCLACHGSEAGLGQAVRDRLATDYPDDRATGYELGQVRGAMTIRRPL
ncbi:MAG: DUF3365 domain-containing protein [Gammaproteobacteria bacterium]|nr:DUF3365 domain-containing protein [Gammaproteobacteria bacterium]